MSDDRHVVVADADKHPGRLSVFSIDGEFIRHVGVGVLNYPMGVAASAFDELVVADRRNRRLRVFSSTGDLLASVGVLGGREGMPRSLGSVYSGSITRFLGGSLRGVASRIIPTPA
jgi:hypothetical protein